MIHDLTANSDFHSKKDVSVDMSRILAKLDDLTPPGNEIVLTGTAIDRDNKRYYLDCEKDRRGMCDCCGSSIRIRPWDFYNTNTLCDTCEAIWSVIHNNDHMTPISDLTAGGYIMQKPWDMENSEWELPTENVLLWD